MLKRGLLRPGDSPCPVNKEIIDAFDYQPGRIPLKTWREYIQKIWEVDPLTCTRCGGEMKIIDFITDVIWHILEHLSLWQAKPTRDPPAPNALPEIVCDRSIVVAGGTQSIHNSAEPLFFLHNGMPPLVTGLVMVVM